jgi:hypothetical protein
MITFAFMELKSPYGSVGCRFGECTNTMILLSFITQEEGQKGANKTCFFFVSTRTRQSLIRGAHCDCDGGWVISLPSIVPY